MSDESPTITRREVSYLIAIKEISESNGRVTLTDIAQRLNVSVPSVYEEVNHLVKKGLVKKTARAISLSEKGEKAVRSYLRAHRVIETLLVRAGVPPEKACELSSKFDVEVPEEVVEAIFKFLGKPEQCPHGNPIA